MPSQLRVMKALPGSLNLVPTFRGLTSDSWGFFAPDLESTNNRKSKLLLKVSGKEGVFITEQGISSVLLTEISNLVFVAERRLNNCLNSVCQLPHPNSLQHLSSGNGLRQKIH